MIKKISLGVLFLFALTASLVAQGTCSAFYIFEEGKQWEYHSFNDKGKLEGRISQRILGLNQTPDGTWEANIESRVADKNDKEMTTSTFILTCKDDVLKMDLTSNMAPGMLESLNSMEVTMEGNQMELPGNLKEGQALPDAYTTISAGAQGVTIMRMTIATTNRLVEARERLETAAGNFDCYKISHELSIETIFKKTFRVVEWYAEGAGLVRSETYDKKGRLESSLELVGMN